MRGFPAAMVYAVVFASACWAQQAGKVPETAAIEASIGRARLGAFWGGVLVARDGEKVFAGGFGFANDDLRPIDADTLFDIGSLSKMFTAAAVLKLHTRGTLSLDDAVSKHFTGLDDKASKITLRHLMHHTSGMVDSGALQRLDFPDRDEAVRLAFASTFAGEPGQRFEYCNAGYVVLAAAVEKASGRRFEDFVRDEIFRPAGMTSSGFIDGAAVDLQRAALRLTGQEWKKQRRTILQDGWGWGLRGAGGVITCLNDLLAWDRALRGDDVLSPAAKSIMFTPSEPGAYGGGWFIQPTPRGTLRAQHSGRTRGYSAQMSRFLDEGVTVAVLTGEDEPPFLIEEAILDELWPKPKLQARLQLAGLTLNEHKLATIDTGLRLIVQPGDSPRLLIVEESGRLRAEVSIPAETARSLITQLRAHAKQEPAEGSITGILAARPYTIAADGSAALPEGVQMQLWPQYRSMDGAGKPIVDDRPTLVVVDRDNGFIPLILRMDRGIAAQLARDLESAMK